MARGTKGEAMTRTRKWLRSLACVILVTLAIQIPSAPATAGKPATPPGESEATARQTLVVTDNPLIDVSITVSPNDVNGFGSGVTDFIRIYPQGTTVTLTAPSTVNDGSSDLAFVRWNLNDVAQTAGKRKITFSMSADMAAQAIYEDATWNLSVQSADVAGIQILGLQPGVTDYQVILDDNDLISLKAPGTFVHPLGKTWYFVAWVVNGVRQTRLNKDLIFVIRKDIVAVAQYRSVARLVITGPTSILEGSTVQYHATAVFTEGPSHDQTLRATWTENTAFLKFRAPGLLHATTVSTTIRRSIRASFAGVTSSFTVTIRNR